MTVLQANFSDLNKLMNAYAKCAFSPESVTSGIKELQNKASELKKVPTRKRFTNNKRT